MVDEPVDPEYDGDGDGDEADREEVERERSRLREFVKDLSPDDIKSGNWFEKLLIRAVSTYTAKVDWKYFQEKYQGVPADGIVEQRVKMAARYAAIEGGLSASAYSGAIIATLGTLGGASPATVPAGIGTLMVDLAFITQLQIRLAYDISVLYRVPLDLDDPDDLWKLIKVAFTIKSGEMVREGIAKTVPPAMRWAIKTYYSKGVLAAAKGFPFVGKFLLQRTVLKVGIPLVGIPVAVALNHWSTVVAGKHARAVFRNEAQIIEVAEKITLKTKHPSVMLWASWLVIRADKKTTNDEALLMRHLTRLVRKHHQVEDEDLAKVIEVDAQDVWERLEAEEGDLSDVIYAARQAAAIDGDINAPEQKVLDELETRARRT